MRMILLSMRGIEANQHAGAFVHCPGFAALSDADQTAFGLDHHNVVGLIDHRLAPSAIGVAELLK